jgi:hypothetical protein
MSEITPKLLAGPLRQTKVSVTVRGTKMFIAPAAGPSIKVTGSPGTSLLKPVPSGSPVLKTGTSTYSLSASVNPAPVLNVFVGGGVGGGSGDGNMTIYPTTPTSGEGVDGDGAYVVSTQKIMRKVAGVWTTVGQAAKTVSDSQVTFETPTAGDGTAELATL